MSAPDTQDKESTLEEAVGDCSLVCSSQGCRLSCDSREASKATGRFSKPGASLGACGACRCGGDKVGDGVECATMPVLLNGSEELGVWRVDEEVALEHWERRRLCVMVSGMIKVRGRRAV